MHKNRAGNFVGQKRTKRAKRTRFQAKTAEVGCVSGAFWVLERMETVGDGCERMGKPGVRTKMHQMTMQHVQKENRRKPSDFAGFVAGAEGLEPSARGFGVDVGTAHKER